MTKGFPVYVRYTSDLQPQILIEDQMRRCREYAETRKWPILEKLLITESRIGDTVTEGNSSIERKGK